MSGDHETLPAPLFPEPPKCKACGTTAKNLCKWAADRHHHGIDEKQPRSCLLRYDPYTADFPEGY